MSETEQTSTPDADLEGQPAQDGPPSAVTLPDQRQASYVESEDHRPDPTSMTGTLETSGTGGGRHAHLAGVSRIFGNVEAFVGQVEAVAQTKVAELVDEVRTIVTREEAASRTQPVTQQTTEDGGMAVHEGDVVQGDGTGVPAPAASPETPADQTQAGTADTSSESTQQSAPVAEQQTLTGDAKTDGSWPEGEYTPESSSTSTTPSGRTPAKKTAAKKTAASKSNGSDTAKK